MLVLQPLRLRSEAGRWPGAVIRACSTLTVPASDSKMLPSPSAQVFPGFVLAFQILHFGPERQRFSPGAAHPGLPQLLKGTASHSADPV